MDWVNQNLAVLVPLLVVASTAAGWMLRRRLTDERSREQAVQYSTIAQTLAHMRAHNVTMEEIEQFQAFIATGQRPHLRASLSAQADEIVQEAALESWAEAEPQSQAEMNELALREFEKRDRELARVILALGDVLSPEEFDELKAAQDKWLAFRDAHAEFVERLFIGGSMRPLWYTTTVMGTTNDRIDELNAYLELRSSVLD
jgi:uncharacterized protein YecT (DUF1311 family)